MPKTRDGEVITWDEFFKRWKAGINGITPLQKLKAQCNGINIQLVGLLLGFVISVKNYNKLWWLGIILFGGLVVTGVQKLGVKQQINTIKDLDSKTKEVSLDDIFDEVEDKISKEEITLNTKGGKK